MKKTRYLTLVATTAGLAIALAGGAASAVRPLDAAPPSGQGEPPKPPKPCTAVVAGLEGTTENRSDHPEPICGTNKNDVLTATRGGGAIWGYRGNDKLRADNGMPDEVIGGDGTDAATIDAGCDTPTSVERVTRKASECKVTPFRNVFYGPADYPVFGATVECGADTDGTRRIRFLEDPILRAVDATENVDWQTVAWRALVFKWDGAEWQLVADSDWLWDRTYDMQVEAFPGNYWRLFTGRQKIFLSYRPDSPGWYRFGFDAHWYATPRVPAHDEGFWAGPHYGHFEDPTQSWCVYP